MFSFQTYIHLLGGSRAGGEQEAGGASEESQGGAAQAEGLPSSSSS